MNEPHPRNMQPALNYQSATAARKRLADRQVSAEQYARACLERVTEREPVVEAWAHIDGEQVLTQARALDKGAVRGPLHGLLVGVKDIIDTADMPTAYGSPIYSGNRPRWDAACVAAIRAAGGIIMGKTVTTEFATSHPGKTRNPHNTLHTPGGSSSGSAASVADNMVPLAIGTQTGGSMIRPASFCGVIGYKPSFGTIHRHGVRVISETLDTVGVYGRSVPDVALLASAITGRANLQDLSCASPPRVAVWRAVEWKHAAPETVAVIDEAARKLIQAGARVDEPAVPEIFAELAAAHHEIDSYELARSLAFEMQNHAQLLTPKLRARIEHGLHCPAESYDSKLAFAAECRKRMDEVFADYDVLIAPSAPAEAPEGFATTGNSIFNRNWTLLGVPCVNVPAFTGPRGLPIGVQVIGRRGHDARALACAHWIHGALA